MTKSIDEAVDKLKTLDPISIFLMGSFARDEWQSKSDAEVAIVFSDENYQSRTKLKPFTTEKVRVYPFRKLELLNLSSVIPFPRKFYFWWLKRTAKTLWGKNVLDEMEVEVSADDLKESITFQKGIALSAMVSLRNGDNETAEWGFSKSCLFGTISALALRKIEVITFKRAVAFAREEFAEFFDVIQKAEAVWEGKKQIEEKDIFRNFEYFAFLEKE